MVTENLERLSDPSTNINDPNYLTYKYLFRDLKNAIKSYAKGELLDIGCGNKPYTSFFEGMISSYIGTDIIQSNRQLVDIICSATKIPLPDNNKDTVFCTQVIEHVADHDGLLVEAFRILKPGGHLILSGPMCWEHHEVPYDYFRFTKYGFEYLLKARGFTDIVIISNGGKWATVGQIFQNSLRSSFKGKRRFSSILLKVIYTIFRIKWIINLFFSWLDSFDKDYSHPLNFVVIGRKPL
jgi:SAM-dependent methyltransferase